MKKFLSMLLLILLVISCTGAGSAQAATKLTKREKAIGKAYVKCLEQQDISYLNKFKYPGVKLYMDESLDGLDLKVISPKYSKVYDSQVKMNVIVVSSIITVSNGEEVYVLKGNMGVNLKTKNKVAYVYSENTTKTSLEQVSLDDLTAKQFTGVETYLISKYGEDKANLMLYGDDVDVDDDDDYTEDSGTTTGEASLNNPVKLGNTYTYSSSYDYLGDKISGKFSITVNSVKSLTHSDVAALGFQKPTDTDIEYKLVNITWKVSNVKISKGTGDGYVYKSLVEPSIWGAITPKGDYVIGGTDYGFQTSLNTRIDEAVGTEKIQVGETLNYTATGDVLLATIKGQENYMVFSDKGISDYDASKMYFKLK